MKLARHRKRNTALSHLHVESKKLGNRKEWWLLGLGKRGNGKILVKSYKLSVMTKFWRSTVEHGDYS